MKVKSSTKWVEPRGGSLANDPLELTWTTKPLLQKDTGNSQGFGFGDSLEIQPSPNLREGWPMSQVELYNDDSDPFNLPPEYQEPFKSYYSTNYQRKRFVDDGEKFMLAVNPISFEEAPTLQLRTRPTQYSKQHFYREVIAKDPAKQQALIRDLVTGSLKAGFSHSCSLQMIVVTKDKKILLTERSQKVGVYSGTWSCSVEEDLQRRDINAGHESAVLAWGKRLLDEELKLESHTYHTDDLRLLSVFLESNCLNISFCAYVEIGLDSKRAFGNCHGLVWLRRKVSMDP